MWGRAWWKKEGGERGKDGWRTVGLFEHAVDGAGAAGAGHGYGEVVVVGGHGGDGIWVGGVVFFFFCCFSFFRCGCVDLGNADADDVVCARWIRLIWVR